MLPRPTSIPRKNNQPKRRNRATLQPKVSRLLRVIKGAWSFGFVLAAFAMIPSGFGSTGPEKTGPA
ncbi:hypothetical protein DSLASN_38670 [Desulfoluna limicola]|uniref:Uncharacterized protein n=1 Tax=Desulfoluna limicola TaxID=2810562 RepID=A0ABM7PL03_9BACT|nr:hypothetical protein DSLASN_38670 [Desulfoluna limicola]